MSWKLARLNAIDKLRKELLENEWIHCEGEDESRCPICERNDRHEVGCEAEALLIKCVNELESEIH
jgi:hypothetical protein